MSSFTRDYERYIDENFGITPEQVDDMANEDYDDGYPADAYPEPADDSCETCKFFARGSDSTNYVQGDAPECGHPRSWISMFNFRFPYEHGCKNHCKKARV